ncbi:MAG: hypothetical protein ACW99G_20640 [Candidatus Thorarchaeota archaeon]|jgi:hypothetical protein
MPYGVDKKIGGDNPSNTKFMERCVARQMKEGKSKSEAIALCKYILKKSKKK